MATFRPTVVSIIMLSLILVKLLNIADLGMYGHTTEAGQTATKYALLVYLISGGMLCT